MASDSRTTGTINISGTIASNVAGLRALVNSRKRIKPSDLDTIRQSYELFRAHTHDFFDQQYLAYDNTSPQVTSSRTATTNAPYGMATDSAAITAGVNNYKTFSNEIFELISNFNSYVHVHQHQFDDQAF